MLYQPTGNAVTAQIFALIVFYARMAYTVIGTIMIYLLAIYLLERRKLKIGDSMVKLSGMCFGTYLYQQFILQYLYYRTGFVSALGIYTAPWIAFLLTLIVSLMLTALTMKTRLGRALIA